MQKANGNVKDKRQCGWQVAANCSVANSLKFVFKYIELSTKSSRIRGEQRVSSQEVLKTHQSLSKDPPKIQQRSAKRFFIQNLFSLRLSTTNASRPPGNDGTWRMTFHVQVEFERSGAIKINESVANCIEIALNSLAAVAWHTGSSLCSSSSGLPLQRRKRVGWLVRS